MKDNQKRSQAAAAVKKGIVGVGTRLMRVMLPLVIAMMALLVFITYQGIRTVSGRLLNNSMTQQISSDSSKINSMLNATFYYMNGIADSVENLDFQNDDEIKAYLTTTVDRYDSLPTGMYLALADKSYIDPSGWDPEKDITESKWYKFGMEHDDKYFYYYDQPYIDEDTKNLCSTVVRHVTLKDGREGVIAADIMMQAAADSLNSVKVFDTGKSFLVSSQGMILTNQDSDLVGTSLSDQKKGSLLNQLASKISGDDAKVTLVRANGVPFYVVWQTVQGTDWKVVDYAPSSDVYSSVNTLIIILVTVSIAIVVVIAVMIIVIIRKLIQKPVKQLTSNIEKIAQGDFTVDIAQSQKNDEISFMNTAMGDFIGNMRDTLSNIIEMTHRLEEAAKRSKETSEALKTEANEQSMSMDQISQNMENMAESVTEVANNATTLAQAVSELSDNEHAVEDTMKELVQAADNGQKDMTTVNTGMNNVMDSMNEMNEAVKSVNESAEQIKQIIDMISSIASQTNLLSLNASIEAARAGEAGRGFAVVASEIGNLANDSDNATKQIANIISNMTESVNALAEKSAANADLINDSASSVKNAADTFSDITNQLANVSERLDTMTEKMNEVNDVATNVASISEEQSASTQEVTSTVESVNESSKKVAESSGMVSNAANDVATAVDNINSSVQKFLIDSV